MRIIREGFMSWTGYPSRPKDGTSPMIVVGGWGRADRENHRFCPGKPERGSGCYLKLAPIHLKWHLSKLDSIDNCVPFLSFGWYIRFWEGKIHCGEENWPLSTSWGACLGHQALTWFLLCLPHPSDLCWTRWGAQFFSHQDSRAICGKLVGEGVLWGPSVRFFQFPVLGYTRGTGSCI